MELLRVEGKDDLPPIDREILNERLHVASLGDVWGPAEGFQEYLALGMSKGSVLLLHVNKLQQLYCRFTVHREAVQMVRYLPRSKTFVSVGRELDFLLWKISPEERNIKHICGFKIQRSLKYFCILDGKASESDSGSCIDRFWLGFQSGDQEVFQYDGESQMLHLIESEKQKEHEAPLTGLDYHRKLGYVVTSCEGGTIRIWNREKKFLREIMFPSRIDSVCFGNARGDLLVSHDKRVSQISFDRYKTRTFDFVAKYRDPLRLVEVTDELLEDLREKDDAVRGKKVVRARTRQHSRKARQGPKGPLSPEMVRKSVPNIKTITELPQYSAKASKPAKEKEQKVFRQERVGKRTPAAVDDYHKRDGMDVLRPRRERDHSEDSLHKVDISQFKACRVTALPPIRRKLKSQRPMPGVSYLSTSGLYEDLIQHRKAFQLGHMTRRNITEHKISSNIMSHNSPVVVQNYDSLHLGP